MSRRSSASATPSQRPLRVGEELRHCLAAVIERGELRDPDLLGRPLTVTQVRVSPDLRNATVFLVPLGGGEVGPILKGLKRAKAFLRRVVADKLALRLVPDLHFAYDPSFDKSSAIETLLRAPEVQRDLVPRDDDTEAEDCDDGA